MSVRRERAVLAAVVGVVLFAQLLLYPGVGALLRALGTEPGLERRTAFFVAEFAAFVVFAGVWGAISDATGRRVRWIVVGAVGGAVGYAALAALGLLDVGLFGLVVAVRVLQGAATIGAFSLAITMLMDLEGGHGRNMGAAGIAIGLGAAVGAPVGGQLTELHPLVPLVVAAGALLATVPALLLGVADRAPTATRSPLAAVDGVVATPVLLVPYAFGLVDRLTAGFFALVGTAYFESQFGLDPGAAGLVLALFFAPFALLQYPMGALSDRIGRTIPVVVGSLCYGLGVIAVGVAPSLALAALGMVAVGVLGAAVSPATMALVTDVAGADQRGTAMAGFNLFGSVGFLLGFLVGGVVGSVWGFLPAFVVAGGLEVAIAVVAAPVFLRLGLGRRVAVDEA